MLQMPINIEKEKRIIEYQKPIKEIEIKAFSPSGDEIIITKAEQMGIVQRVVRANPQRRVLFRLRNSSSQSLNFVSYNGQDGLILFAEGGIHRMNWHINREEAFFLKKVLSTYLKHI